MLADDEHGGHFDGGLGIVALLEAAAHFHHPAFGIGVVVLVLVRFLFAGALFLGLAGGEFEDLMEGVGEEALVFAPKLTDRVMVGVGVAGEETYGDVFVNEHFAAAVGENARRLAIYQYAQHHGRRVLGVSGALRDLCLAADITLRTVTAG